MEKLRQIRERAGYSQQELADTAGVSQHTISEIELSRRKPQGRTLRKLAGVLGVEVADFFPKAPASPPDFEDERRVDVYGMVLAAARRQANQDEQAAARTWESERPQTYFMRHENEVVVRLLEHSPDEVAGTLVEMARHCVQLESRLSKEATSAEAARSAAT